MVLYSKGNSGMSAKKTEGDVSPLERMTPNEFRAELVRKGWTFVGLFALGYVSQLARKGVAGRVDRPRYWDDAVRGLPDRLHLVATKEVVPCK